MHLSWLVNVTRSCYCRFATARPREWAFAVGGRATMAEAKTKITDVTVEAFLDGVEPPAKREEGRLLDALFRKATGAAPKMWGPSIIG